MNVILPIIAVILILLYLIYRLILKDIFRFVIQTNDDSSAFKDRIKKENGT